LYFIRKLYIILKLGLFISESGPSLRSDSPIARIGEPGGTEHISASPLFHSPGDLGLVLRSGTFPPARCMRPLEPMDLLVPQHTAGLEIGVLLAIECGGDQPCFILPTSATTAGDP
jgi:hypothetical protein